MYYNIIDYGALSDGKTLATSAIQAAIDDCYKNGGGRVVIPSGNFYSGSLFLKDNVELHLEHGATLTASESMDDYNADDAYVQNYGFAPEQWRAKHLIMAVECKNVAITGSGVIDGNGDSFRAEPKINQNYPYSWRFGMAHVKDINVMRPGQLICFIESRDVLVDGITLRNTPCWCIFIHGCEFVRVSRITVLNKKTSLNTDGIDIDSSRFVTVSDCNIETGDDAITFRCAAKRLKTPKICEHITVTNCNLAVSASAFRIGVGTGQIRHVRVSNITVARAGVGMHFMTSYNGAGEAVIEDVNFSGISLCNVGWPFKIDGSTGKIKNVTVDNVRAHSLAGIRIIPDRKEIVSDLTLRDFDLFLVKDERDLTPSDLAKRGDDIFYAKNISGIRLLGLRIFVDSEILSEWASKFKTEDCDGIVIKDCDC